MDVRKILSESIFFDPEVIKKEKKLLNEKVVVILPLSVRAMNCLNRQGIEYMYELVNYSKDELKLIKNIGSKTYREILILTHRAGLKFRGEY